jgi:3-isopropylmalate dehydratase small subunit
MAAAAAVTGTLTDVRKMTLSELPAPKDDLFIDLMGAMENSPKASGSMKSLSQDEGSASAATTSAAKQFVRHEGIAAKMDIQNIDTDMIIPKQFLKTIKRSGLGVAAFNDLRYEADGSDKADFILNQGEYRKSSVIVAGDNFGCGSSREHAPWALHDFGIRVIISTSFADIFYNNCFKNGLLPIVLPREEVEACMADADAGYNLDIDLASQSITRKDGSKFSFDIDPFRKHCLLNGLDDIGLTMERESKITSFEKTRSSNYPWLDNAAQSFVNA